MKRLVCGAAALSMALAGAACRKKVSEHAEGSGYGVGRHDPANIIGGGDKHTKETDQNAPSQAVQATAPYREGDLIAPDGGAGDGGVRRDARGQAR